MEKNYFSRLWSQKSAEWISRAITDIENYQRIDTNYLNGEIEFFFKKFSYEDTMEGEWYRENINTDDTKKAKFESITKAATITVDKVSFLPKGLKYSVALIFAIVALVIALCVGTTAIRALLIGAFIGIMAYYFVGNFQNRANKRKAKELTDNIKSQLDEIYKGLQKECGVF